jgi:hypothetical protein
MVGDEALHNNVTSNANNSMSSSSEFISHKIVRKLPEYQLQNTPNSSAI